MTTPVDLARLRKARDACIVNSAVDFAALAVWHHDLSMAATPMMDELESLRAEVDSLRGMVRSGETMDDAENERAAIVAMLQRNIALRSGRMTLEEIIDAITDGDHHA